MRELSLNILDIVENSVVAGALNIKIFIRLQDDYLTIRIEDDGKGMSEEFLKTVTDPFTTSRHTRRVGMGIPLLKQAAESAGGQLTISSALNVGTTIEASFLKESIDRMPLGDIANTISSLILTSPSIEFYLIYGVYDRVYEFNTLEFKKMLDGLPIENLEIITYIRELIEENINLVNGGVSL